MADSIQLTEFLSQHELNLEITALQVASCRMKIR